MRDVLGAPWFAWAIGIAVVLPVALVVLTEVQAALARRGSVLVRPLSLVRNWLLPVGALLVLLTQATEVSASATPVRVVATVFGAVVLVLLLSGLGVTLFDGAPQDSWRRRIPSIFVDVARFALIAIGLGVIASFVWGADVGGLFTALGVSSIVLGLALQNSVGQIISGLFVLFEQPFALGDWLRTPSGSGRVTEVNWRATHIDTGDGLLVLPNAQLAGTPFTNLSRSTGGHDLVVVSSFGAKDPPDEVCRVLREVGRALPQRRPGEEPVAVSLGDGGYRTHVPLHSPADDDAALAMFHRWLWYAARRALLRLDGVGDDHASAAQISHSLDVVAPVLQLTPTERAALRPHVRVTRFGAEETLQHAGQVPTQMTFVVRGRVRLAAIAPDGATVPLQVLGVGDFLGQTTLTREPVVACAVALTETAVVHIGREHIEALVGRKPSLLADLGRTIEDRRARARRLLAAAARG